MATYNQPDLTWTENPANPNFLFAREGIKKTERDEGAGIFTTLKTAILNLGPDLATELGYVGEMLKHPIDTGKVLLKAAAGYAQKGLPDAWEAYLPSDWATNKIYAEAINQHYIERYGSLEGAADAFAENPVSVLLDVFIVKGVLTAAVRQSAKLNTKINSTLNSAKGTPLEGEIAIRADAINQAGAEVNAASEATKAAEINKGALVFDEATGVYVPVSSVGKSVNTAEAAGGSVIINGKVVHIPKPPKSEVAATGEVIKTSEDLSGIPAWRLAEMDAAEAARVAKLSDEAKAMEAVVLKERMDMYSAKNADYEALSKLPLVSEEAAARLATYPIMNQAQRAAVQAADDVGMITGSTKLDDAVKVETAALSTEAADLSKLPNYSRLAKQAEIDDLARISKMAETAKAAEATRYSLARKEAGDMYPAVKTSELATVGKGGDLASIPNIARPWKATEISQKLPLQAIARTVKLAETAGNMPPVTAIGLEGQRTADGSFYPDYGPDLTPAAEIPVIEKEVVQERRPGWMQGNTYADNDGNFWSADFEHEHWNTPAGVNEAISIWGRPMGSRHSWETPAAIKNQYTYRQPADFSWMNEYD